jgi:hypothetical protein
VGVGARNVFEMNDGWTIIDEPLYVEKLVYPQPLTNFELLIGYD